MKRIITILIWFTAIVGCEKIPEREPIILDFVSVNGTPATSNVLNGLDYNSKYAFAFKYESKSLLKDVRIRLVNTNNSDIEGLDSERLSKTEFKDTEGTFIYNLNPKEQCEPPKSSGLKKYYFIKIIMINEDGVVTEDQVQFDFN